MGRDVLGGGEGGGGRSMGMSRLFMFETLILSGTILGTLMLGKLFRDTTLCTLFGLQFSVCSCSCSVSCPLEHSNISTLFVHDT